MATSRRSPEPAAPSQKIPTYTAEGLPGVISVLRQGEALSAIASGPAFIAVGTTFGAVHVLTLEGLFVTSLPAPTERFVTTEICIASDVVVASISNGVVVCWDWRMSRHTELTVEHGRPLQCMAISPDFGWSCGTLYVSQEAAVLLRRSRTSVTRFTDSVIFEETDTKAEFDRFFHGFPSQPGEDEVSWELQPALIQNLTCDEELVFFSWKEHVYAFSELRSRVVSRFGNFPTFGSDGAKSNMGVSLAGDWLAIFWGTLVMLCDRRNFAEHPFRVVWRYSVPSRVTRISLLAQHMVVCVNKPVGARDDQAAPSAGGALPMSFTLVTTEALLIRLVSPEVADAVSLPPECGPVVSLRHAQCQAEPERGDVTSGTTHCFLLCPRALYVLRCVKSSEQVLGLLRRERYPQGMHLCQQVFKQEQVCMEVANMHANSLWRQGKCVEAVRVWGEVILPSAPAAYWNIFVALLEDAGELGLIIKWLPFNDRTKVSPEIYERLLLSTLQSKDYRLLLARVSRWPVLYETARIKTAILVELEGLGVTFRRCKAGGGGAYPGIFALLASLLKLCEFSDQFCEALQVLVLLEQLRDMADTIDTDLGLEDASYEFALKGTLKYIRQMRATEYFVERRLFSAIAPATDGPGPGAPLGTAQARLHAHHVASAASSLVGAAGATEPSEQQSIFSEPSFANRLLLTREELRQSPIRRHHLLISLMTLDEPAVVQVLADHSADLSVDEVAMMLEDAPDPAWLRRFLQACVCADVALSERHRLLLFDA